MAWSGIRGYWKTNGSRKDAYGRKDIWDDHKEHKANLLRHTPSKFGKLDMKIYEPCNYASNIAYYHAVTRICSK